MWKIIQGYRDDLKYESLKLEKEEHIQALRENARLELFEFSPSYIHRYKAMGRAVAGKGRLAGFGFAKVLVRGKKKKQGVCDRRVAGT